MFQKIAANNIYSKTRTNFTISQKQNKNVSSQDSTNSTPLKLNVELQQNKEAVLNTNGCNIFLIIIVSMLLFHNRPVLHRTHNFSGTTQECQFSKLSKQNSTALKIKC